MKHSKRVKRQSIETRIAMLERSKEFQEYKRAYEEYLRLKQISERKKVLENTMTPNDYFVAGLSLMSMLAHKKRKG